jgi:alpha-beta hydrolase superfamily lysophospholipase
MPILMMIQELMQLLTRATIGTIRHTVRLLLYGTLGVGITLLVLFVLILEDRPDLKAWHTADLDEEFTASSDVYSFAEYLELEARLFQQLQSEVYDRAEGADRHAINRYHRGSLADPQRWPRNWNRSFELGHETPHIAGLLIHGVSDSPYSLRSLGERLHQQGAWVTGLRVPGHGTAPVGLVDTEWQDMAAAVTLPAADGLVLLSPEIGISRLAALAVWQVRLSSLLGLDKLAWSALKPEYDPFKYNSFPINAGKQAHELTAHIQSRITQREARRQLDGMPPILAFLSVIDATVSAPAVMTGLFARLPPGNHELVLFDINRNIEVESLLISDPTDWLRAILAEDELDYTVTVLTNADQVGKRVVGQRLHPGDDDTTECVLDVYWPPNVYSLSHVAPPFPPDDPLYGGPDARESPGVALGNIAPRGERGALRVSAQDLLRLRWNPFHRHMTDRVLAFTGLADESLDCQ